MPRITALPLPPDSLLARHMIAGDYGDCFVAEVAGTVTLQRFIAAFYSSGTFTPERVFLGLIGRGADAWDIAALAEGHSTRFAAWTVEAREGDEILLRDFMGETRSWLKVEPHPDGTATRLLFGSGVGRSKGDGKSKGSPIGRAIFAALTPLHRLYARALLAGAVRGIGKTP